MKKTKSVLALALGATLAVGAAFLSKKENRDKARTVAEKVGKQARAAAKTVAAKAKKTAAEIEKRGAKTVKTAAKKAQSKATRKK